MFCGADKGGGWGYGFGGVGGRRRGLVVGVLWGGFLGFWFLLEYKI